jgi:hypothetical protein
MPHPDYAPQSFICVLNPSAATFVQVRQLLAEAYARAVTRDQRHRSRRDTGAPADAP